ncbi:hypothetical protein L218DRAFT_994438 [Marasmius fiardii PR-910]|nr:hypothetical protein L218DRAFT_994438 [Marasmius fiardii PR-910]
MPQRHEDYFIETIVFQVDDTLFRVPARYFHEKSEVFQQASQMSAIEGEGSAEDLPIKVPLPEGSSIDDFILLLKVVWAFTTHLAPPIYSRNQWISVLALSTFWEFTEIRKYCVSEILATRPTFPNQITLGRTYGVKTLVFGGLQGLANLKTEFPPIEGLAALLGADTVMRLLHIRFVRLFRTICEDDQTQINRTDLVPSSFKDDTAGIPNQQPRSEVYLNGEEIWSDQAFHDVLLVPLLVHNEFEDNHREMGITSVPKLARPPGTYGVVRKIVLPSPELSRSEPSAGSIGLWLVGGCIVFEL